MRPVLPPEDGEERRVVAHRPRPEPEAFELIWLREDESNAIEVARWLAERGTTSHVEFRADGLRLRGNAPAGGGVWLAGNGAAITADYAAATLVVVE